MTDPGTRRDDEAAGARSVDDGSGAVAADEARNAAKVGQAEQIFHCDLCGHVMLNLHCKLICERCGFRRDCSDP